MSVPIHEWTVCEIAGKVRAGICSASEVLEHHLQRIEEHNHETGAFVFLDPEGAREAADEIDGQCRAGRDPGPLAGVPFAVKELEDVCGWPHTMGARVFADRKAETTSTQVARMRRAGAIAIGLTASPEMGAGSFTHSLLHGVCRNPHDTRRTPGGSSGGSAAAVAAGLVPLATGSDSGGSLRIPASFCGLVGFKGTYGRVPRGPRYVGLPNIRNYGALTRSVRDTARFLDVVVGAEEHDPLSLPHPGFSFEDRLGSVPLEGLRWAWTSDLGIGACDAEVEAVVRKAVDVFAASAGLKESRREVTLPDPEEAWRVLAAPDLCDLYSPFLPERASEINPILVFLFEVSRTLTAADFARAGQLRSRLDHSLAELFADVDLLLLPTTSTPAFAAEGPAPGNIGGRAVGPLAAVAQTYVFNLSGHPAVSIPAGFVDGTPIGLQIVGRRHEDLLVLAAAAAAEQVIPTCR